MRLLSLPGVSFFLSFTVWALCRYDFLIWRLFILVVKETLFLFPSYKRFSSSLSVYLDLMVVIMSGIQRG